MCLKTRAKFLRRSDVRLTLWYVVTFVVSVLMVGGFLYWRFKHQLVREVDRMLLDETRELVALCSRHPEEREAIRDFENTVMSRTNYPIYFRIFDSEGKTLHASESFKKIGPGAGEHLYIPVDKWKAVRTYVKVPGRNRPFRFISTALLTEGKSVRIIQMGTHVKFVRKNLVQLKRNMLIALPVILLLGSLGGWLLARKALAPVDYIAEKTRTITSQNLRERLTPRGSGDEMDDLIQTINEMIVRLEGSFKRMAEFTADASHELKTPICAMRGEAEVILSRSRAPEEYRDVLVHFIEQFDHLNRIVNDLLLLSKFDSFQVEMRMEPLRLDLLVRDIANLFQVLAEEKGIVLEMAGEEEVTVVGDKVRLQQLFTNLVDNALKYTEKGSVRITLEKQDVAVSVRIHDTGIGIPEGEQEKIFRRFYRVDKSRSKETGGVGLGLSIAEWIVHAHKGGISVCSRPGQGSVFTVTLPISSSLKQDLPH